MKEIINKVLSFLFPHKEPIGLPSVFIQEKWIDVITRPSQIQDYLWHPPVDQD